MERSKAPYLSLFIESSRQGFSKKRLFVIVAVNVFPKYLYKFMV